MIATDFSDFHRRKGNRFAITLTNIAIKLREKYP
jgi:hypothetical protein